MAIYRKNAGRAKRWRESSGKKLFSSLKEVTAPSGVRYGIKFEKGLYFKTRDGKKIPKSAKSTDTRSDFQYYLNEEQAAFFLARMADPDLGKSQDRRGSKFVKDGEANLRAGRMMGSTRKSGSGRKSRASTQKKVGKKARKGSTKSKHGYDSPMSMKWGEDISLGDAWAVFRGEITLKQAKGGKKKANPGRRRNGKRSVSFYDLY